MSRERIDSTRWTGDTSHREPSITPEARALIGRALAGVMVAGTLLAVVIAIAKEVL